MENKFSLGTVVGTPGALAACNEAKQEPREFINRHAAGDWGEIDEHDRRENEFGLEHRLRLMSVYTLTTGVRIWVISEADRSSTCLLLPDEY